MNCATCEDREEYSMSIGPKIIRCGIDEFRRWCGVNINDQVNARPWCAKRRAENAQVSDASNPA